MRVYMEATTDEIELPVAIADSPRELASIVGNKPSNIISSASKSRSGKKRKYISVDLEDEDEGIKI